MIQCRNLTILHDSLKGIHEIDLLVPQGGCLSLLGPSGCGKSTLLHGLAGWIKPLKGEILFSTHADGREKRLGIVSQDDALFPWLTAYENAAIGLSASRKEKEEILEELFLTLGLEKELFSRYPGQLSGGQRQRVGLARTLACQPDILLLDEPTASLDPFTKESLQNLLFRLHEKNPITTLLVTHSIEEALFLGEYVLIMSEGRIRRSLVNPLYPDPEARDHPSFYQKVLEVRTALKEAGI